MRNIFGFICCALDEYRMVPRVFAGELFHEFGVCKHKREADDDKSPRIQVLLRGGQ